MKLDRVVNLGEFRALAKARLPRLVFDYIDGGADDEAGIARNRAAFERHCLLPRYLSGVDRPDPGAALFGRAHALPFGIAPVGLAGFARPGADAMMARAAVEADIPFVMSGAATISVEALAKIAPRHAWFQLYTARDRRVTEDILRRARDAGIEVLVLTVDMPVHANRERDIRNGMTAPPTPTPAAILDMLFHPAWLVGLIRHGAPRFENWAPYAGVDNPTAKQITAFFSTQVPFTQTWHDLDAFRRLWPGKLVLKGILHPEDARRAQAQGMDGVILSNHGGRQLDSAPAPLDMLPAVRRAVGPTFALMLDSGIRRGSDIVKARALGADFTFIGRPAMFATAAAGEAGTRKAIALLRREIELILAQIGCPRLAEIDSSFLADGRL